MSISVIRGNIFTTKCQVLVNTINCVGVMGAGLALEFRLRYPEMHEKYVSLCSTGKIDIGVLWLYKAQDRWILNFPTKKHWRHPSKISYLEAGLEKFVASYKERGIASIAFPLLGADKGKLPPEQSLDVMKRCLEGVDIPVEIYQHDRSASDDIYDRARIWVLSQSPEVIAQQSGIGAVQLGKLLDAVRSTQFTQLNQLAQVDGVGPATLERLFRAVVRVQRDQVGEDATGSQRALF